jgi:D-tyrosyl-tRNA(Tyr) deacylase
MIALLQRVSEASVHVAGERIAHTGAGLLVLAAVERHDGPAEARRLAERIVAYRVFADEQGRMNLDVRQSGGGILLVPQFTLAADTRKGNRPGFSTAAEPAAGRELFETLARCIGDLGVPLATGRFGADMAVSLVNQGPVTIWLRVPPAAPPS